MVTSEMWAWCRHRRIITSGGPRVSRSTEAQSTRRRRGAERLVARSAHGDLPRLSRAEPADGPRRSERCLLARGRRFCELCFVALLICELSIAYIRDAPVELHETGRRCRVVVNSVSDVNLLFRWPRMT